MKNFTTTYSTPILLIASLIALFSYSSCTFNDKTKDTMTEIPPMVTKIVMTENKSHDLKIAMNKLWEDHIIWTRNVILCLVDNVPGTDQALKRLMQNQTDIGNAIKPYYGEDAGNKLTELLKTHIAISADVVKSAKAKNKIELDLASKQWYANADEISALLSQVNSNWALTNLQMMMNDHLKLTTDQAMQRIKKDYNADIVAFDKVHENILKMSAMLADGIIKQFPEKFK